MQVVIDGLNWISGLGPMCMMPIIMFVIGVCLRQKMGVLLRSCLMTGVGFAGVNMTINFFIAQVAPAVQMIVISAHKKFSRFIYHQYTAKRTWLSASFFIQCRSVTFS